MEKTNATVDVLLLLSLCDPSTRRRLLFTFNTNQKKSSPSEANSWQVLQLHYQKQKNGIFLHISDDFSKIKHLDYPTEVTFKTLGPSPSLCQSPLFLFVCFYLRALSPLHLSYGKAARVCGYSWLSSGGKTLN